MGFIGPVGEAGLAGEKVCTRSFLVNILSDVARPHKVTLRTECCAHVFFREIEGRWGFPDHLEKRDRR